MIPTIETIVEDLLEGKITKLQAMEWLHLHAEDAGRTLRDDFAAAALTGFCSAQNSDGQWCSDPENAATEAYRHADAMIARREQ